MEKPLTLFGDHREPPSEPLPDIVTSSGRRLTPTVAFGSYWHLAAERQAMLFRRLRGDALLTHDTILRDHRFTNAYRAADRVSQFLIQQVITKSEDNPSDIVFRVLLFKLFNRIETWTALEETLGEPIAWQTFSFKRYNQILTAMMTSDQTLYSNAYMMPNPPFGQQYKHTNHLELISQIIRHGLVHQIANARSLEQVYQFLKNVPSFGPFLAFQYTIDLNYTDLLKFNESDFVVAGPGAVDGIRKCFTAVGDYDDADVIRIMTDIADEQFALAGIQFTTLWGRPLQLIDCQNLFCEVDKYSRLAHPHLSGESGRSRIKQRYTHSKGPLPAYMFPKRWNIDTNKAYGSVSTLTF